MRVAYVGSTPLEFFGTTPEEESAILGGAYPVGGLIEPSYDEHGTMRVFAADVLVDVLAERLKQFDAAEPGFINAYDEMDRKLTAISGAALWIEPFEDYEPLLHTDDGPLTPLAAMKLILAAGELVPKGVPVVHQPGYPPGDCYSSAVDAEVKGVLRTRYGGFTLYGRSHLWLAHSWGKDHRGNLVELTPGRAHRYYGAPLGHSDRQHRAAEKRARRAERNRQAMR
jgi:hypothetical protein